MDGFYPYHEMNAYMGLIALALAVVGAAALPRPLGGVLGHPGRASAALLMLGKFTFLFDHAAPRSRSWAARGSRCGTTCGSRWPWRRWRPSGSTGSARPGAVRLRPRVRSSAGWLVLLSIPILLYVYAPVWTEPSRWVLPVPRGPLPLAGPGAASSRRCAPSSWPLWPGAWPWPAARTASPRRRRRLAAAAAGAGDRRPARGAQR